SIESRTNQWSEKEHTNYEIQVYLLLLLICIIQTYIQLFLFLLLNCPQICLIVCLTSIGAPMEAALEIVNQTFVSILSGNFICICTGVFGHVGLTPRFINDNINIIIFEIQHKSIRSE